MEIETVFEDVGAAAARVISPRMGELGGNPEGGAVPRAFLHVAVAEQNGQYSVAPPSALPGISPTRGEISHVITAETDADIAAREALLDRAMGPKRKKKSSEKLRRGRRPSEGLAFVARNAAGTIVGTVRLWDVMLGDGAKALLLGPLAVDPMVKSAGIGSALMRDAIAEAARLGHRAILLVGDAAYYARFGFSAEKTGRLAMPGPYERHRFLALELVPGALDGVQGVLKAAGRKARKAAAIRLAA